MMKYSLIFLLTIFSSICYADLYVGGQFGKSYSDINSYSDKNVFPSGPLYGGFIGVYSKFLGLEAFYSKMKLESDINHDDVEYVLKNDLSATGLALRFSFEYFFLRTGIASFSVKESTNASGQELDEINQIYDLVSDDRKSGVMFGGGFHWKMTKYSRIFIDYSRYQVPGYGSINTFSFGLAFLIPADLLSLPDNTF